MQQPTTSSWYSYCESSVGVRSELHVDISSAAAAAEMRTQTAVDEERRERLNNTPYYQRVDEATVEINTVCRKLTATC